MNTRVLAAWWSECRLPLSARQEFKHVLAGLEEHHEQHIPFFQRTKHRWVTLLRVHGKPGSKTAQKQHESHVKALYLIPNHWRAGKSEELSRNLRCGREDSRDMWWHCLPSLPSSWNQSKENPCFSPGTENSCIAAQFNSFWMWSHLNKLPVRRKQLPTRPCPEKDKAICWLIKTKTRFAH